MDYYTIEIFEEDRWIRVGNPITGVEQVDAVTELIKLRSHPNLIGRELHLFKNTQKVEKEEVFIITNTCSDIKPND